ncbi:hypothetical protein SLA2020_283620 [Shorea laevis]
MDKSWITLPRTDPNYRNGVLDFIQFALENTTTPGKIVCPCKKCYFRNTLTSRDVYDHLVSGKGGFMQSYTTWYMHGEQMPPITSQATNAPATREPISDGSSGMQALLHDVFPVHDIQVDEGVSQMGVEEENIQQNEQSRTEEAKKFFDLLKESEEPLWSECTEH